MPQWTKGHVAHVARKERHAAHPVSHGKGLWCINIASMKTKRLQLGGQKSFYILVCVLALACCGCCREDQAEFQVWLQHVVYRAMRSHSSSKLDGQRRRQDGSGYGHGACYEGGDRESCVANVDTCKLPQVGSFDTDQSLGHVALGCDRVDQGRTAARSSCTGGANPRSAKGDAFNPGRQKERQGGVGCRVWA